MNLVIGLIFQNRSPEELELLEEKIARIRKNNEAIIKRKQACKLESWSLSFVFHKFLQVQTKLLSFQIIEEEIKEAKLRNAVVNTNRSYDETDDAPTLYADSVEERTRKLTDIVYPKVQQVERQAVWKLKLDQLQAWLIFVSTFLVPTENSH